LIDTSFVLFVPFVVILFFRSWIRHE